MSLSVDCSWNPWQSWSSCTKTCGGGTKQRSRTIKIAVCGGADCTGNDFALTSCNTHCCAGKYLLKEYTVESGNSKFGFVTNFVY